MTQSHPILLAVLLLLTLAILCTPTHARSVAQQFNLSPKKAGHMSACWYKCHAAVTANVPSDWGNTEDSTETTTGTGTASAASASATTADDGINALTYITMNCKHDLYLQTMADCFPVYCESTWDVEYAVEYGRMVCEKGGVKNVTFPVAPSYTSTAGGYFATGVLAASSSAAPRALVMGPILGGTAVVIVGVLGGVMAVL